MLLLSSTGSLHRRVALFTTLAILAGCQPKSAAASPSASTKEAQSQIHETILKDENLVRQEVDLDRDGKAEIVNFYRPRPNGRLLVKKEIDLNRDGRTDLVSMFDDSGNLTTEVMDSDYDGNFDWTDHYQDGNRVMSEYDTEADGKPNVFKYYETSESGTHLTRKERDTDGDGRIDVWERFDAEGKEIRTGMDTDGDGTMDQRSE